MWNPIVENDLNPGSNPDKIFLELNLYVWKDRTKDDTSREGVELKIQSCELT
jgi:hypothetical protein